MTLYDISRPLAPTLAVWPGDTPFAARRNLSLSAGDAVNLTTLTLSSHTGTHADAPFHYDETGRAMAAMPLDIYLGPATVYTVSVEAGPLTPLDFPKLDWDATERLLVHSGASHSPLADFPAEFVYPSPELADKLGQHGVRLFGTDAPSVDPLGSKTMTRHQALGQHGIAIVEGLLLADVPDGVYELIALPLKIEGGDGSPLRAMLRTLA